MPQISCSSCCNACKRHSKPQKCKFTFRKNMRLSTFRNSCKFRTRNGHMTIPSPDRAVQMAPLGIRTRSVSGLSGGHVTIGTHPHCDRAVSQSSTPGLPRSHVWPFARGISRSTRVVGRTSLRLDNPRRIRDHRRSPMCFADSAAAEAAAGSLMHHAWNLLQGAGGTDYSTAVHQSRRQAFAFSDARRPLHMKSHLRTPRPAKAPQATDSPQ